MQGARLLLALPLQADSRPSDRAMMHDDARRRQAICPVVGNCFSYFFLLRRAILNDEHHQDGSEGETVC